MVTIYLLQVVRHKCLYVYDLKELWHSATTNCQQQRLMQYVVAIGQTIIECAELIFAAGGP